MKLKNKLFAYCLSLISLIILVIPATLQAEDTVPTETATSSIETINEAETITTVPEDTVSSTPFVAETVTSTATETVKLTIRVDSNIVFTDSVIISNTTTTVSDNQGVAHDSAGNTVLGMVHNADTASALFDVTDLAYYTSFDSFLINCIKVNETPSCYNWQYTVNDVYPFVGIDEYNLKSGDNVYLYFGNQNQFILSTTTVKIGEPLGITTEKYDYRNNIWNPRPNVTVGATKFDPVNPWTPIVVISTLADSLGKATLYFTATGTLNIGIGDDYYYPTQTITIVEAQTSVTSTPTTTPITTTISSPSNGPGGSGGSSVTNNETTVAFDVAKAIQFLANQQDQTTGAIGSATLYSDWAAIAVGSYTNSDAVKSKLVTYLQTDPNPGNAATDFERRAMALLALGINPYTGTKTNYINEILKTYQGNQFGDIGLVNDDIFAVIPLLKVGYTATDTEIKNSVAFILSHQNSAGGWESPDLTAAAVQALSQVNSLPGVVEALTKTKNYLKLSTKADGRIGDNSFSTSWGTQALVSLGESITTWNGSNDSPLTYLAKQQQTDGGIDSTSNPIDNRIWSTSYAIPAAQNKTWLEVLSSFSKVEPQTISQTQNGVGGSGVEPTNTPAVDIITTSTVPLVTTTSPAIVVETTNSTTTNTNNNTPNNTTPAELANNFTPSVTVVKKTTPTVSAPQATNTPEPAIMNDTSDLSGESLTVASSANQTPNTRRVFGGAAAVAGTAGAYLAWRFAQSLL